MSRIQVVFWLDAALLVSMCALETVPFTGLVVHEWLAVGLAVLILCHLLFAWTWIEASSKKLAVPGARRTRINYLLNLCLFICAVAVIFSGLVISEVALPALGIQTAAGHVRWRFVHDQFSNLVVLFAGLHLAMNWDWCEAAAKRCLGFRG